MLHKILMIFSKKQIIISILLLFVNIWLWLYLNTLQPRLLFEISFDEVKTIAPEIEKWEKSKPNHYFFIPSDIINKICQKKGLSLNNVFGIYEREVYNFSPFSFYSNDGIIQYSYGKENHIYIYSYHQRYSDFYDDNNDYK